MFERKTMSSEGQHERQQQQQRIGQAKCQKGGGGGASSASAVSGASVAEQRSGIIGGNSVNDDSTAQQRHHVVETRRIKKERHYADASNDENGTGVVNNVAVGGETATVAPAGTENGHQSSRSNSSCRTNGFHPSDMLQEIIAAKFGQTSTGGHGNANKNDKIRLMIEDSLSEDSKNRVQEMFLQVEQLKIEEKLLLYLRLPASLANPGGTVDPLRQPLNPLGNRYEIHQTIMWIKTHLEEDPDVSLPKQEVYDEYNVFCIRNAMKPLSTADFGKVMKQVYPRVRPRRLGTRGNSRYCYAGMRKRVKLDTPTLPCVAETATTDDFDETITEEMLGAASIIIREWAESLLKMKFSSLSALARHLVENLRVDTRSLSAVCILSATGDSPASINTKVSETSPSLSVTPVAGKPGKLREAQLQLQRKLQQREHTRDQKNRQIVEPTLQNSAKEKPAEIQNPTTTAAAATTTTITITTATRSSSIGKSCKKSKTSQSPLVAPPAAIISSAAVAATAATTVKSDTKPIASSPAPSRSRKLPRATQAPSGSTSAISPHCDEDPSVKAIPSNLQQQQMLIREGKTTMKNSRKRTSLEASNRQNSSGESSSPEKQAKLTDGETIDDEDDQQRTSKSFAQLPSIQRVVERVTLVVPSYGDDKIADNGRTIETRTTRKIRETTEDAASLMEKMTNGRTNVWESIAVNRLEDKLCTIDPDALDDYLNGGNNSQEQEEELLQYFQQSNSSSDIEASFNQSSSSSVVVNCDMAESASRSDKVSQLRLILQQNLKVAGASRINGNDTTTPSFRRTTPVAVVTAVAEPKIRENRAKQHDIVLPILVNHAPTIGTTRRRVSFETSVIEQQLQQQQQQQQQPQPELTSQQLTMIQQQHGPINTVPQSPNTRRRIFNFTPISPGPHSPINGRAASASKPNSANASPFVSPRNTPVPRSRSNLQSNAAALCRSHRAASQKALVRSISCSVPYRHQRETFVVPTTSGNSDNSRLPQISAGRTSAEAQSVNVHNAGRALLADGRNGDEAKLLENGPIAAAAAVSFLNDLDNQRQLIINYPSQENLQEIKNVYGSLGTAVPNPTARTGQSAAAAIARNCQPAADREISELFNGSVRQQAYPTSEQLYYRSQSVPLHRMVNPTLMSPISSNSQFSRHNNSFNDSSSSSIAPTPVPSEFNDFVSIGAHDAYLLDEVDTGFIADDQQFLMEDKESITKILNILDEEGRQSMTIMPASAVPEAESLMDNADLTMDLLEPLPNGDIALRDDDNVIGPRVDNGLGKIIESKSYPNTPLPVVGTGYRASGYVHDDNNSNGSRSYPTTPLNALNSRDIYRESNEPMLSSPTLNSLNLRGAENPDNVNDGVICRNVTDLLEGNFGLGDNETDNDDLDPLGNFDGLQDVDSLTPLFNEVTETNR